MSDDLTENYQRACGKQVGIGQYQAINLVDFYNGNFESETMESLNGLGAKA